MRRRGFTLIEVMIASAVAATLITLLYTTLIWYSRSFQREDENLERSRRAQEVLGLFRDDFGRAAGTIEVEDVPLDALKSTGWEGSAADFLTAPRSGVNQVNAWTGWGATSPYASKTFEFIEKYETKSEGGKSRLVPNTTVSSYLRDAPAESQRARIPPRSAEASVVHVAVPPEKPRSEWILIRRETAGQAALVVWAFHREKLGKHAPGTLLRHSEGTGLVKVGGTGVADFRVRLAQDWMFVDAAPPQRPQPDVRLLATLARVELKYATSFEASAVLLKGP